MLTLPNHFKDFLSNIEPDEDRREAAQEYPGQVRDFLQDSDAIDTIDPHSRLVGSYARSTAINHIKDVDILLFIDSAYQEEYETADVLETLFSALQELPDALDDEGEVVKRRHQRRSINVQLEQADFDLDIVPAVVSEDIDEPIEIPDKDWNEWVETHPLGYATRLSKLNQAHNGKVVRIIKMIKHWRDVHMKQENRRPKSYWLSCMVYHRINDGDVDTEGKSYAELFRDVITAIYDDFAEYLETDADGVPEIPDPMLGHNVAHRWEEPADEGRSAFEYFMRNLAKACGWADRALEKDDDERDDAIALWQNIFGEDWFPTESTADKGRALAAAMASGTGAVSGETGRISITEPTEHHVKVPPTRYYGDG